MFKIENKRIWVPGHNGMVGRAVSRQLKIKGAEVISVDRFELDLLDQLAIQNWLKITKIDGIIVCAAKVGGILANNNFPAEFMYNNLMIAANIVNAAKQNNVEKLLFLGSSCIYPKYATQPIKEDALLTGALEPTNEWYALAKIAGIKLCQSYRKQYGCDFISAMPTNLYGPHDNFDLETSHVVPALMRKAHEAKIANSRSFKVWGNGTARREFLFVDDCAEALVFLMENYSGLSHVNVGTGVDISISNLAYEIKKIVSFDGEIEFEGHKPEGTPVKRLDVSNLNKLGWKSSSTLHDGLIKTYQHYLTCEASRYLSRLENH